MYCRLLPMMMVSILCPPLVSASDTEKSAEMAILLAKEKMKPSRNGNYDKLASSAVEEAKSLKLEKMVASGALSYDRGYRASVALKKPMLVMVNVDCQKVCEHLRPEFVTVHEKSFQGSNKPRVILVVPVDDKLYRLKVWDGSLPSVDEIRRELKSWLGNLKSDLGSLEYHDHLFSFSLSQWPVSDCPGGVCPVPDDSNHVPGNVAVSPSRMPIADGPVVYEYRLVGGDGIWFRRPMLIRRSLFLIRRLLGLFW